jgi:hypothetical protein
MNDRQVSALQSGLADRSYVFEGAYRARGTLSLAERSAYGMRARAGRFGQAIEATQKQWLTTPFERAGAMAIASRPRQGRCADQQTTQLQEKCSIKAAPAFSRQAMRTGTASSITLTRAARPGSPMPMRFTVVVGDAVVYGLIQHGRVNAAIRTTEAKAPALQSREASR